jgi:tetratricopeptide (TPR) repeat protein
MILSKSIRLLSLFFYFAMLAAGPALAQETVDIRGSDHDGYTRLVFDWPEKTDFSVAKNGDALSITFGKPGQADPAGVNAKSLRNAGSVSVQTAANGNLSAMVPIGQGNQYRDFSIGSRVIIDIYDGQSAPDQTASRPEETTSAPSPAAVENEVPETQETEQIEEQPPSPPSNETLETVSEALETTDNIVVDQVNEAPLTIGDAPPAMGGVQPHVIILSTTESVGMAAFEREGFLWLVFDRADLKNPPILSGPNEEQFANMERVALDDGVAYRMPVPDGLYFYGEGGGILWRFVMTPTPRRFEALRPTVTEQGALSWPMEQAGRILEMEDPFVGDTVKVVTVRNASEFAVDPRGYVDLDVLPSYVGLAFVPKADEVEATKTGGAVVISKPGGLAVSPEGDMAAYELQDDIEKEVEIFEAQDNPEMAGRIFDFERWEMGGLTALEKNRQILMNGMGEKEGAAKAEDLITLAKLNIANNRGPEALGLLRVAAEELPGIEENPVFKALEGAASVLGGRYDEALVSFFLPALTDYEEIDYWKAYALAGLEDWQQADDVMPDDLRVLEDYPAPIREPMVLALAETALRDGKTRVAEDLLMSLEPDFPDMQLNRQAAWKYLNGELERQQGDFEAAMENWQPLLAGTDDYYRAKAGLSVTRMQLERSKITPAQAVDRLEGLRYAWRGDELESLINFRLGEVYVGNKEYLKGLSVLRNAVSISPNAKISEEITDYMTDTFRGIFTNGELENLSPIEAVSIYEEFKELTPLGAEGDLFVQQLAEKLVEVDLLGRAAALLDHQVNHRLEGKDKARVAIRLAAIRLINGQPDAALLALEKADEAMRSAETPDTFKQREIRLLRARALSKTGQATQAISLLNSMAEDKDVLSLRADIAWAAGQWDVAAAAFKKLIDLENINPAEAPEEYQATLILNRAIALNLSGERTALDNLRGKYEAAMDLSDKARLFDLVTRPRKLGLLGDRESVSSLISEVDLFGAFLEGYRDIE